MKNESILIYGANGYTGKLIYQEALRLGLDIHIAGRNKEAIEQLAQDSNTPFSIISLEENDKLIQLLANFKTVIHCAGPFSETAEPMVKACIQSKTNYLDITGEIWVFETVMRYTQEAEVAGIKLISGCGFDVVPTDCLASKLHKALPDANALEMAFVGEETAMSRGTAVTMAKNISKGGFVRKNGKLKNVALAYKTKQIEFPHKKKWAMTIPWGDLMTAFYQTNIPSIEIYSGASPKLIQKIKRYRAFKFLLGIGWIQKIVRRKIENTVTGPNSDQLEKGKTYLYGKVSNNTGDQVIIKMITPEAYKLTALTALKAAQILNSTGSEIKNGYLTPSQAFGDDFISLFEGVEVLT